MKILVVCGNGLGSSMIMEMTVEKALSILNIEAEINHTNLSEANTMSADLYVCAKDLADMLNKDESKKIILTDIANSEKAVEIMRPFFE